MHVLINLTTVVDFLVLLVLGLLTDAFPSFGIFRLPMLALVSAFFALVIAVLSPLVPTSILGQTFDVNVWNFVVQIAF